MASESDIQRERNLAQRRRLRPVEACRLVISYDSGGHLGDMASVAPVELALQLTDADGEIAAWFDDYWWAEILERFGDEKLTIHIEPTPSALLHAVVLFHLDMIYRVAPPWRVVGHAYRSDLCDTNAVEALAKSAYHEVRFFDQDRPGTARSDRCLMGVPLEELFGQIRREQTQLDRTAPVLVRVPPSLAPQKVDHEAGRRPENCTTRST